MVVEAPELSLAGLAIDDEGTRAVLVAGGAPSPRLFRLDSVGAPSDPPFALARADVEVGAVDFADADGVARIAWQSRAPGAARWKIEWQTVRWIGRWALGERSDASRADASATALRLGRGEPLSLSYVADGATLEVSVFATNATLAGRSSFARPLDERTRPALGVDTAVLVVSTLTDGAGSALSLDWLNASGARVATSARVEADLVATVGRGVGQTSVLTVARDALSIASLDRDQSAPGPAVTVLQGVSSGGATLELEAREASTGAVAVAWVARGASESRALLFSWVRDGAATTPCRLADDIDGAPRMSAIEDTVMLAWTERDPSGVRRIRAHRAAR